MLFALLMVGVPAAIIGGFSVLQHRAQLAEQRMVSEWNQQGFDKVKQGATSVTVFHEGLLAMLAADAECAARIEKLDFATPAISPTAAQHVAKLSNLKGLYFYATGGSEHVLEHSRRLKVEDVGFSSVGLTEEHFRYLAEFTELKGLSVGEKLTDSQREWLETLGEEVVIRTPSHAEE